MVLHMRERRWSVVISALEIAKWVVGVDYVDFTLDDFYSNRSDKHGSSPDYLYDQSEEALIAYFTDLRAYIDELGLTVAQTHGRGTIFFDDPAEDAAPAPFHSQIKPKSETVFEL